MSETTGLRGRGAVQSPCRLLARPSPPSSLEVAVANAMRTRISLDALVLRSPGRRGCRQDHQVSARARSSQVGNSLLKADSNVVLASDLLPTFLPCFPCSRSFHLLFPCQPFELRAPRCLATAQFPREARVRLPRTSLRSISLYSQTQRPKLT